jgi:hypothetical protein
MEQNEDLLLDGTEGTVKAYSPTIIRLGLWPCIFLAAYDREQKVGYACHHASTFVAFGRRRAEVLCQEFVTRVQKDYKNIEALELTVAGDGYMIEDVVAYRLFPNQQASITEHANYRREIGDYLSKKGFRRIRTKWLNEFNGDCSIDFILKTGKVNVKKISRDDADALFNLQ